MLSPLALLASGAAGCATAAMLRPPSRPARPRHGRMSLGVVPLAIAAWWLGAGSVLPLVGLLFALGGYFLWRRASARRQSEHTRALLGEALDVMAAELAAGRPAEHALREAARVWPGLAPVVEAATLGSDVPSAMRRTSAVPGAGDLRLAAAAWKVSDRSGRGLAAALQRVARGLRARRRTARVVQSELASARATARLVALLPVVALGMGSGAGGDPWRFLLHSPIGLGCLVLGSALILLGLGWIEALADRVQS